MQQDHKEMLLATLRQSGSCLVRVHGKSMWPFVRNGDQAIIQSLKFPLKKGIVVAFFMENQLCIKRLRNFYRDKTGEYSLVIQGDSSPMSQTRITLSECIGQVTGVMRNCALCKLWFSRPFCALAIPLGILFQSLVRIKTITQQENIAPVRKKW